MTRRIFRLRQPDWYIVAPVHALLQKLKINASDAMARADAGSSYQLLLVKGVNRGFFLVIDIKKPGFKGVVFLDECNTGAKFKMKAGSDMQPGNFLLSIANQLMVNCWFGLVVWDSRGTPK